MKRRTASQTGIDIYRHSLRIFINERYEFYTLCVCTNNLIGFSSGPEACSRCPLWKRPARFLHFFFCDGLDSFYPSPLRPLESRLRSPLCLARLTCKQTCFDRPDGSGRAPVCGWTAPWTVGLPGQSSSELLQPPRSTSSLSVRELNSFRPDVAPSRWHWWTPPH